VAENLIQSDIENQTFGPTNAREHFLEQLNLGKNRHNRCQKVFDRGPYVCAGGLDI